MVLFSIDVIVEFDVPCYSCDCFQRENFRQGKKSTNHIPVTHGAVWDFAGGFVDKKYLLVKQHR